MGASFIEISNFLFANVIGFFMDVLKFDISVSSSFHPAQEILLTCHLQKKICIFQHVSIPLSSCHNSLLGIRKVHVHYLKSFSFVYPTRTMGIED